MKERYNVVRTPNGTCLGIRIILNGKIGIRYKAGKRVETLFPEQIVEYITGVPVDHIVYKKE